jgi:hypothetical protein|tara:strand:+ start:247 stop:420 length:174 start_codon:yes stop_codon:yes gene_type:complete
MTPLAQNILNAANSLPLPPMKSYAGIISLLKRTAVVINNYDEQSKDIVRIPHKGFCS